MERFRAGKKKKFMLFMDNCKNFSETLSVIK